MLLDSVVAAGDLTGKQRDELLAEMTAPCRSWCSQDNYEQTETLSLAEAQAAWMLDVHTRFLSELEADAPARPRAGGAARRGESWPSAGRTAAG